MSPSQTKATSTFDPAEYLDDDESIAAYLTDALESDDPAFVRMRWEWWLALAG
jgi:DNA-binding phage protein